MYVRTPGCAVPFRYDESRAEEQAKLLRKLGATRDVAYGSLLRLVIDENENCDLPAALAIAATRGVCEQAVAAAWAA